MLITPDLRKRLQEVADDLRQHIRASRTTIRSGETGQELLAESLEEGVESMRSGPKPAISAAPTYEFLRSARALLIQDDCSWPPLPPSTLTGYFDVHAQMLAPILDGTEFIGTISVHQAGSIRRWGDSDVQSLATAWRQVQSLFGLTAPSIEQVRCSPSR